MQMDRHVEILQLKFSLALILRPFLLKIGTKILDGALGGG
jgi:hypothetical protein